ncbi:TPA: hypothetical protein ROX86_003075 [Bacillus thuringiensis]|nr:Protein of unknown function [Bacillus cereus]HDX9550529.1 hypothetical protein [Bacillus thuringiensis]
MLFNEYKYIISIIERGIKVFEGKDELYKLWMEDKVIDTVKFVDLGLTL